VTYLDKIESINLGDAFFAKKKIREMHDMVYHVNEAMDVLLHFVVRAHARMRHAAARDDA
jgi:hypothetical protein